MNVVSSLALLQTLLLAAVAAPATSSEPQGAFELLERVRTTYRTIGSYRDRGEIVRVRQTGSRQLTDRLRFETASAPNGAFRFLLEIVSPGGSATSATPAALQKVIWSDGHEAWHYDSGLAQFKPVNSVAAELAQSIGLGAMDALLVPMMLTGPATPTWHPEAASLEGDEACGTELCTILLLTHMAGTLETRLWVERENFLIHRVDSRYTPPSPHKLGRPVFSQATTELRTNLEILSAELPLSAGDVTFEPPSEARLVDDWSAIGENASQASLNDLIVRDTITVDLLSIVLRVVDHQGHPVLGLTPEDFVVRHKRQEIPIVAVDWVASQEELKLESGPGGLPPAPDRPPSSGNLVVLFIQADFNPARMTGQMRLQPSIRELVRALHPDDWVAVVSFDSHLKLWHDFTRDREALDDALAKAIRFGGAPVLRTSRSRSLGQSFPFEAAREAATPEKALRLTAEALKEIPGEKIMIYLGWGLGEFGGGNFHMTGEYEEARAALNAARTSVFVLDVTDADYHTLELGIRQVAEDTGGTYAKTNVFPEREAKRLGSMFTGYYLLTLDRKSIPTDAGKLGIKLRGRKGTILSRARKL